MKRLISLLCIILVACFVITPTYANEANLKLYSEYAYLYDVDTSLEYISQKSDQKIYPASMTKILTAAISLEKITDIQEKVIIEQADLNGLIALQATTAGFYAGEKVTYEDLIYGALLPSGADACNALARLIYGNTDNMVKAMNQKIKDLGLKNTHFQNVTGLHDQQHYTTAQDMANILNYALKNANFKKAFETGKYIDSKQKRTWVSSLQRAKELKNIETPYIDGAKSGFTDKAQLTLASTMNYQGHRLILVTAKAQGQKTQNHVKDANTVYQYLTNHFKKFILYKKDEQIHSYLVLNGFYGFYGVTAPKEISILISNNINPNNIEIKYDGKTIIHAPISRSDTLGVVKATFQGQDIYEYQVHLSKSLESSILAIIIQYLIITAVVIFLLLIISRMLYRIFRKTKKKKARFF